MPLFGLPAFLLLSVVAGVGLLWLINLWNKHRDRPFPPGCCKRCGLALTDRPLADCPRCGHVPHCWHCGYNLTGNFSGICSECGREWATDRGP